MKKLFFYCSIIACYAIGATEDVMPSLIKELSRNNKENYFNIVHTFFDFVDAATIPLSEELTAIRNALTNNESLEEAQLHNALQQAAEILEPLQEDAQAQDVYQQIQREQIHSSTLSHKSAAFAGLQVFDKLKVYNELITYGPVSINAESQSATQPALSVNGGAVIDDIAANTASYYNIMLTSATAADTGKIVTIGSHGQLSPASFASGGVSSVNAGSNISITGSSAAPIVNLVPNPSVTSLTATGAVNAATVTTSGAINAASLTTSGAVNANTVTAANSITLTSAAADVGKIFTVGTGGTLSPATFATGGVTSVNAGTGITITGTAANPVVNLNIPVSVTNSGTGTTSFSPYAPIIGGTTATGALQSASSGISNVGYVLTSTGASSVPTWQAAGSSGGLQTIDCDASFATQSAGIMILHASPAGESMQFVGSGNTITLNSTDANNNTAIGLNAGLALTSGANNTALGFNALTANATASNNTAIGYNALSQNVSSPNTAMGFGALAANTSGSQNTAVGYKALYNNTTGLDNVAIGNFALYNNTGSIGNIAIGFEALYNSTLNGGASIAVGNSALNSNTTGFQNVAIGANALSNNVTGTRNVAIGVNAGLNYTGGESNNLVIYNSGIAGESNTIHIGTSGTGPGEQNACYIAGINGVTITPSGGAVYINSNGQLGTTNSSQRYKDNIQPMRSMCNNLMAMKPVEFIYKSDKSHQKQYGLIAEDVEHIDNSLIMYNANSSPETIYYQFLPPMLLKGLQEQQHEIEILKAQNKKQQQQIDALFARCMTANNDKALVA